MKEEKNPYRKWNLKGITGLLKLEGATRRGFGHTSRPVAIRLSQQSISFKFLQICDM